MARVACSTSIGCGTDLENALLRIDQVGSSFVDLLAIDGWVHVHPSRLVQNFDAEASELEYKLANRKLICMNTGVGPQLHDRSEVAKERRTAETQALIQLMKRTNVDLAAIQPRNPDPSRPWTDVLEDCVQSLQDQFELAKAAGVAFALELHVNSPFETFEQAHQLIKRMPDVPLVYDPTHFVMQGANLNETAWMLPHTKHVQLRDAAKGQIQVPFGTGDVDFDWLFGSLKDAGYAGRFSVEYLDTNDFDVVSSAKQLYEKLAANFEE
jgi:sugar phosphate isomerase/epimerase